MKLSRTTRNFNIICLGVMAMSICTFIAADLFK